MFIIKNRYILLVIILAIGMLHLAIINRPNIPFIGDESIYVPAALHMLNGSTCAFYNQSDANSYQAGCNLVHPPLVKLATAGSIAIFGNNPFGWRIFVILTSILSILAVFFVAKELTKRDDISLLSAGLLGIESMFFVQSSGALLDVPSIFFGLVGMFLYLKFKDKPFSYAKGTYISLSFALSILSKETGMAFLAFVILYGFLIDRKKSIRFSALLIVLTFAFSLIGLQLFDSLFTNINAITNIRLMIDFHLSFTTPVWNETAWPLSNLTNPLGPNITPLNWITLYSPFLYYGKPQLTTINYTETVQNVTRGYIVNLFTTVHYGLISNMIEVWLIYLWVPLFIFYLVKKRELEFSREAALFVLLAFFLIYGGYVLLFLLHQSSYPFYFVQFSPFLAVADALFVCTLKRREFKLLFIVLCVAWFLWFFPVYPFILPVSPYGMG